MPSFDVTFLGHQGWLLSAGESRLLVDPLLTSDNGHGGAVGDVFPPRRFTFDAFPRLSALLLSHEHEDHFDVASLLRVDRGVPVLLSARSSIAAGTILGEMGFSVTRVHPGETHAVGDIELSLFAPDTKADVADEWDVLPYLVEDRRGHGSFFSTVDVALHPKIERAMAERGVERCVWSFANNALDFSCMQGGDVIERAPFDSAALAQRCATDWSRVVLQAGEPIACLLCGGGMSFSGDRAWLNRNVFRASSERVAAALANLFPGPIFAAPRPGETFSVTDGILARREAESAFLRALPEREWPAREWTGDVPLMHDYAPFTAKRELSDAEIAELERELASFAAFLYGSALFRALFALDHRDLGARRPTFSLVLLRGDDDGAYAYEYDATACAFVEAQADDPVEGYVGGLECWASDLLAVLRGEIGVGAILFGRGRAWNALPEACQVSFDGLWMYAHPLRRPDRALALYRRLCDAAAPSATVRVGR